MGAGRLPFWVILINKSAFQKNVVLHTMSPVFLSFPLLHVFIGLPYSSLCGHPFCPFRPKHCPCSFAIPMEKR